MHLTNAHRRLGGLVRRGLLDHRRLLHGRPGIYIATRAGLDSSALSCRPRVRPAQLRARRRARLAGARAGVRVRPGRGGYRARAAFARYVGGVDTTDGREFDPATPCPQAPAVPRAGCTSPTSRSKTAPPEVGCSQSSWSARSRARARREIVAAYQNGIHVEQVRYYGTPDSLRGSSAPSPTSAPTGSSRSSTYGRGIRARRWVSRRSGSRARSCDISTTHSPGTVGITLSPRSRCRSSP